MKIRPDDEGELNIVIGETIASNGEHIIVIDFGKQVKWIGLSRQEATTIAMNILRRAVDRVVKIDVREDKP